MTADVIGMPKSSPGDIVRRVLDGVEANAPEVLADSVAEQLKQNLSNGIYLRPLPNA
jgi:hypothetical protein